MKFSSSDNLLKSHELIWQTLKVPMKYCDGDEDYLYAQHPCNWGQLMSSISNSKILTFVVTGIFLYFTLLRKNKDKIRWLVKLYVK